MSFPEGTGVLEVWQVDVFTENVLTGNPAAVVFGGDLLSTDVMQSIAREKNLSETIFILPPTSDEMDFSVRIFTTRREIPFAVHPVLAAACAFSELQNKEVLKLVVGCKSGLVTAERSSVNSYWSVMSAKTQHKIATVQQNQIAEMLGVRELDVSSDGVEVATAGVPWMMVEILSKEAFEKIDPDFSKISDATKKNDCVGATVFVRNPRSGVDAQLRAFAPAEGIMEDPVCGSCGGALGAHLAKDHLETAEQINFLFEQGNEIYRPGRMFVSVRNMGQVRAVYVGGFCTTVMKGRFEIGGID